MIFVLLIAFQIKMWLADYLLQTPYMLGKFRVTGWVKPLLAHVAVHAVMTLAIAAFICPLWLAVTVALLDASIHFCMDRVKASPNMLGRYKSLSAKEYTEIVNRLEADKAGTAEFTPTHKVFVVDNLIYKDVDVSRHEYLQKAYTALDANRYFWIFHGLDQCVHHLTHYVIIWILLN
jgi:hypothetical protein